MNERDRHLLTLKLSKMRFRNMGEILPKEYADELEKAYPAKQARCHEANCGKTISLDECQDCEYSWCSEHMAAHFCTWAVSVQSGNRIVEEDPYEKEHVDDEELQM